MTQTLIITPAEDSDLTALHPVVESAYRGDAARQGWTHEADLLSGARTDIETLRDILANPDMRLLIAKQGAKVLGCVQLTRQDGNMAYLGLLCVDPTLQAAGLGRQLIAAAEACARTVFAADIIEMTVIEQRRELIAYYERRGYARTGERRDFPIAVEPPLFMAVLAKHLDA